MKKSLILLLLIVATCLSGFARFRIVTKEGSVDYPATSVESLVFVPDISTPVRASAFADGARPDENPSKEATLVVVNTTMGEELELDFGSYPVIQNYESDRFGIHGQGFGGVVFLYKEVTKLTFRTPSHVPELKADPRITFEGSILNFSSLQAGSMVLVYDISGCPLMEARADGCGACSLDLGLYRGLILIVKYNNLSIKVQL